MEKYVVRKAFDTPEDPYLPQHILYRQKEQFSDGVGYGWIDSLRDWAAREVSDRQMSHAALLFPHNTPMTKEGYMYRRCVKKLSIYHVKKNNYSCFFSIFNMHFEKEVAAMTVPGGKSIACSTEAALAWDKTFQSMADPSGRAISGVHVEAYAE